MSDGVPMTELLNQEARHHPPRESASRKWWVLAILALTQLMITLDITIVNIALPAAQRDLGFSDAARQWVITAYALAFGSLLLISGRIADRIGRRKALFIGLGLFGVGSALGGAAPNFLLLVIARATQGVGGALLAPAALATMTVTFVDAKQRARAFSVFGAIAGVGGALGLLLGGLLTEHLNWRWTLYVNLGIAVVALIGCVLILERDEPADRRPLDITGSLLVTLGIFCLVFGFSRAETEGWSSPQTWASLLIAGVLLVTFTGWQIRARNPLLPLRILLDRDRGASLLALMTVNVGIFAVFLFLTYYLQATLGYSPVKTGIAFLPLIGGNLIGATLGLNILPRWLGPRVIVPGGLLLAAANMAWLTDLGLHTSYASGIFTPLLLLGIGLGMVYPPTTSMSTARLNAEDNGVGGAVVNTTQQVGGSVGIALLSTLAASATTSYLTSHHGTGGTVAAQATVHGYATTYWIAAGILAVGALVVAALFRPIVRAEAEADADSGASTELDQPLAKASVRV